MSLVQLPLLENSMLENSMLENYRRLETHDLELAISAYELALKQGYDARYGRIPEASFRWYAEVYAISEAEFSDLLQEAAAEIKVAA